MSAELLAPKNQASLWLPPREMWLYNPERDGLLETPTDQYGLVDLDKYAHLLNETVSSEFSWKSPFSDIHHLQNPARNYPSLSEKPGPVDMRKFRELTSRKLREERIRHNWGHKALRPAAPPSVEVMIHCIQAEEIAVSLFRTARLATRLTRMPQIPEKKLEQRLNEEYENYALHIENAREVPKEFSRLALDQVEAKNVDEMLMANRRLGKLALETIPVRKRPILQAA